MNITRACTTSKANHATIKTNNNSLLFCANKLLTEIANLKRRTNCKNPLKLRNYLLNEIQKFQITAENLHYNADNILISRYALSATLDEIIIKTAWGAQAKWQDHTLLQELQQGANADEHFFTILEQICRTPNKFIDNIELMYVCLSLGFEGKFHHQENTTLQKIIAATYQLIRACRGEIDKKLSPTIKPLTTYQKKTKKLSLWPVIIISCTIMVGVNYALNLQMKNNTTQLAGQIKHMENYHALG